MIAPPMDATLRLSNYDAAWPTQFEAEAARIQQSLDGLAKSIEHVGSTSVPGLVAKPIIDIAIAVRDEAAAEASIGPLEALGYQHRGPNGDDLRRRYFVRNVEGRRVVQIHMYILPARGWDEMLAFRDALRADARLRDQYAAEKWRVAGVVRWDKAAYSVGKNPFIQRVLAHIRDQ